MGKIRQRVRLDTGKNLVYIKAANQNATAQRVKLELAGARGKSSHHPYFI